MNALEKAVVMIFCVFKMRSNWMDGYQNEFEQSILLSISVLQSLHRPGVNTFVERTDIFDTKSFTVPLWANIEVPDIFDLGIKHPSHCPWVKALVFVIHVSCIWRQLRELCYCGQVGPQLHSNDVCAAVLLLQVSQIRFIQIDPSFQESVLHEWLRATNYSVMRLWWPLLKRINQGQKLLIMSETFHLVKQHILSKEPVGI